jgi:hypothetical protein
VNPASKLLKLVEQLVYKRKALVAGLPQVHSIPNS